MANDPVQQFQISTILPINVGGLDLSFTNSSAYMVAVVALTGGFLVWATRFRSVLAKLHAD